MVGVADKFIESLDAICRVNDKDVRDALFLILENIVKLGGDDYELEKRIMDIEFGTKPSVHNGGRNIDYSIHAWGNGPSNKDIKEKLGSRCFNCGAECGDNGEIHHIVPRSAGGENRMSNFAMLCKPCHYLIHYGNKRNVSKEAI